MNTNDFIKILATGPIAVEENSAGRHFMLASGWGLFGATLLMAIFWRVRPDMAHAITLPMFWFKLAFPVTAAIASLHITSQLASPGKPIGRALIVIGILLLITWIAGTVTLISTPVDERSVEIFGATWTTCPFSIALLSLAPLVGALSVLKEFAPTRRRLAGASAGLFAGCTAAAVYALHCPEMTAPFLGIWYVLGIAISTVIGSILGPLVARW
jgi:hypothetical protein